LLGTLAAILVFVAGARQHRPLTPELRAILVGALCGGSIGAKLAVVWRYVDTAIPAGAAPTLVGFFLQSGQSVLGGLAGAYVGAVLTKKILGYRAGTGDLFAP